MSNDDSFLSLSLQKKKKKKNTTYLLGIYLINIIICEMMDRLKVCLLWKLDEFWDMLHPIQDFILF